MVKNKDIPFYLILAIALVVIIAIGVWIIISSLERSSRGGSLGRELGEYSFESPEEKSSTFTENSLKEGDEAPDFRLESIEGEFIDLGNLKEEKFLLVFFNSQCGFCKKEMQDLVELARIGKEIIAIAIWGDEKDDLIGFARELGVDFPILIDKNDEIAGKYFIKGTPTNFLIDKNGVILEKHRGYAPRVELERILGL